MDFANIMILKTFLMYKNSNSAEGEVFVCRMGDSGEQSPPVVA